jgi:hypothetical protein
LFLTTGSTQAQYTLQGKATDANAIPLPGAHIALQYPWGEDAKLGVTEADGSFKLTDIEQGGYKLKISFLGFEDLIREVTFNTQSIDLGILQLETAATQLAEVQVKEKVLTATQQGDTTSFNADAFKVMKDASAEDLVGKMPTVSVQGGKVQAQGEDVKQVLVDGKPFFGKDPTAALRNLPAEVIEKVQIYDQLSDQAQFTGFNDGNTSKTINIITRPNMRAGQFGKVYAGYGYDDKWQGGGNVNYFEGNRRISLIGMTNNINIQNFSSEDLAGAMGGGGGGFRRGGGGGSWGGGGGDFLVSSSGGVATTHALGLNYSDKWGEKMEVSGSYFFNNSSNRAEQVVSRQFVNAEGPGQVYDESSLTLNNNTNHRANFRFEYKIDSSNSLIMRPNLSVQLNNGDVGTNGVTALKDLLLNSNNSDYHSDLKALNVSNNLLWRHKFAREGRTFSINLSGGYAPKSGNYRLQSLNAFFPPLPPGIFDTLNQQAGLDAGNWNTSANISYTEPLGKVSQLQLEYQASYQQEESDRETYDFSPATGLFDQLNEPLSNVFSNDYYTHRPSLGYNYRKENLTITARGAWQHASLLNDQTFPQVLETEQRFSNFLPFAMVRWDINGRAKNLRLFYRTYTNLPSIEQLQNVVDNSNPLQLRVGNPKLRQSYSHSLFWRYQATNTEKSTVFYAMLGGSLTDDFIANATYLANSGLPIFDEIGARPGAIITQPVNLSGNRSLRSFVTYGFPLRPIKSNLNLELSWNYARTPGLVNIDRNIARSNTYGAGLSLSSNISTRVDFTIAARPSFNRVNNSLRSGNDTEFFSQNSSIRFNWIILEGFVLRNDLTHQYYSGLSGADFNQNFWLWNFGIGKKLFKNERGEITLTVNDLLSQNRSISRTVTETYIQDTRTNALTRFIMMTFTYNIRHFGSQPSSRSWDGERRWEGGGRPPFMPPH